MVIGFDLFSFVLEILPFGWKKNGVVDILSNLMCSLHLIYIFFMIRNAISIQISAARKNQRHNEKVLENKQEPYLNEQVMPFSWYCWKLGNYFLVTFASFLMLIIQVTGLPQCI